jgi:hypothetical protein
MRQKRTRIQTRPQQAKCAVVEPLAKQKQERKRDAAQQSIGQPCSKFIHPKDTHTRALQPKKQRRLLPKWLEIYLRANVVAREQHFARDFGKINLVPIKQMHRPQKRQKQHHAKHGERRDDERIAFVDEHFVGEHSECKNCEILRLRQLQRQPTTQIYAEA